MAGFLHKYIMLIYELSIPQPYLYHATTVQRLMNILCGDELTPRTSILLKQDVPVNSVGFKKPSDYEDKQLWGVSTTRNPIFALTWDYIETSDEQPFHKRKAIIVLDRNKLQNHYKIYPYEYFHSVERTDGYRHKYSALAEAEEFIPGGVKNLSKYLVSIIMTPKAIETLAEICREFPNSLVERKILEHPKLNAYIPPIIRKEYALMAQTNL